MTMHPDFARRYLRRFAGGMIAYSILLVTAILLHNRIEDHPARFLLGLIPVPAVLMMAWAAMRFSREADELAQRQLAESLSIGFWIGSALVVTYGLMDIFGAPQLSWMFAFVVYMACWAVGSAVVARRYR